MSPRRIAARTAAKLWTRDSSILLGGFFVILFLIVYIWWPLAEEALAYVDWNGEWWRTMDWLLLGIFGFMSITIIARANIKNDLLIILVGICGGLGIELWGTTRECWTYYTYQTPPLFAVLAHGMAAVAFWRAGLMLKTIWERVRLLKPQQAEASS